MKVFQFDGGRPIKAWIDHVPPVEEAAMQQLRNIASMPFIHSHVACMPDVHWGNGTAVGSVIATKNAIIPASCGVDIGCGVSAVRTSLKASQLPDNLFSLRMSIESVIPHGRSHNGGSGDVGAWRGDLPKEVEEAWACLLPTFQKIAGKHPKIEKCNNVLHVGTLGTGNHFWELCLDESDNVWVMLHSGSRGLGNRIGSHFIELAKQDMKKWFINVPDQNLAYLVQGTSHFDDYCEALRFAQQFAQVNRDIMMMRSLSAMKAALKIDFDTNVEAVSCHHNYVAWERHFGDNCLVTRKGAVRAQEGDLCIIPGAMGKQSFICRGKGNRDSFNSCSHGAGRLMSRTEAKKRFTLEDHAKATEGVECRKDADVIDETPAAYKDLAAVMKSQESLIEVLHTLTAIVNIKG